MMYQLPLYKLNRPHHHTNSIHKCTLTIYIILTITLQTIKMWCVVFTQYVVMVTASRTSTGLYVP